MSANLVEFPKSTAPRVSNLPSCFKRTTVSLEIEGKITVEQWMAAFATLDKTGKGYQWWIGDSLIEGEGRFPEQWSQVLDPAEEAKRENEGPDWTYTKYMQVASRMARWRRRQSLSFGHHQCVAFMETQEEQDHWLDLTEENGWSVDKLRKKIKGAREGGAENDPALDLQILQHPAIRQWLDDYRALVSHHDDELTQVIKANEIPGAKFLHRMTLAHIDQVTRQSERTLAVDCGVVKKAVAFMLSATFEVVVKAMRTRGFFMSDADLADRLQLLVDLGEVKKEKAEEQRHAGARGDVVWEFKTVRKAGQVEKDKEDDGWV